MAHLSPTFTQHPKHPQTSLILRDFKSLSPQQPDQSLPECLLADTWPISKGKSFWDTQCSSDPRQMCTHSVSQLQPVYYKCRRHNTTSPARKWGKQQRAHQAGISALHATGVAAGSEAGPCCRLPPYLDQQQCTHSLSQGKYSGSQCCTPNGAAIRTQAAQPMGSGLFCASRNTASDSRCDRNLCIALHSASMKASNQDYARLVLGCLADLIAGHA